MSRGRIEADLGQCIASQFAGVLGLILCSDKKAEQIELLQLDKSGIRVATYLTELPPRPILEKRLHQAVRFAQSQITKAVTSKTHDY